MICSLKLTLYIWIGFHISSLQLWDKPKFHFSFAICKVRFPKKGHQKKKKSFCFFLSLFLFSLSISIHLLQTFHRQFFNICFVFKAFFFLSNVFSSTVPNEMAAAVVCKPRGALPSWTVEDFGCCVVSSSLSHTHFLSTRPTTEYKITIKIKCHIKKVGRVRNAYAPLNSSFRGATSNPFPVDNCTFFRDSRSGREDHHSPSSNT